MNETDLFNLFFIFIGFYTSLSLFKKYGKVRRYREKRQAMKRAFKIKKSMFGEVRK